MESFFAACVYARDRLNTHLFVYAVSVAVYHRNDTKNVVLPSNVQVLPHLYVNNKVFAPLKEELGVIPEKFRVTIYVAKNVSKILNHIIIIHESKYILVSYSDIYAVE